MESIISSFIDTVFGVEYFFYSWLRFFTYQFGAIGQILALLIPIVWTLYFVGKLFERTKKVKSPMKTAFIPYVNLTEFSCVASIGRCSAAWIFLAPFTYALSMYKFSRSFKASIITSLIAVRFPYIVLPILYLLGEKNKPYVGFYYDSDTVTSNRSNKNYTSSSYTPSGPSYSGSSSSTDLSAGGFTPSWDSGPKEEVVTCPYCGAINQGGGACPSCLYES
ncbi:MAG: hypothetical protein N4A76_14225 [Firmicutes bacterium]|jgi:hypothetical protein|nr:hypothetical protein [Bacillota bacterium]